MKKNVIYYVLLLLSVACTAEPEDTSKYVDTFNEKKREKEVKDSLLLASLPKEDTNLIKPSNVVNKLTVYGLENPETKVKITTKFGAIHIKLYDDTPLHRANFIMLTKHHYFDSTLFYRVVNDFMIQGGNSDREVVPARMKSIGNYTIPDEVLPHHIHKRGALAMAVSEQLEIPEAQRNKYSSPCNFYIVQNGPMQENYMKALEKKYDLKLSTKDRETYRKYGGAPHLDGKYTVFGEVVSGFDVIDKIASLPTDKDERPMEDVTLSVEIVE